MEQRIRLLIADDQPRSRDGLRALLATCSAVEVVGEAANGEEALLLMEDRRPTVVLMDARMPVLDGMQATRLIKSSWPEVRIVVLTMYSDYREIALAAGADAFLVKGCQPEELFGAIAGDKEPA